QAADGDAVFDDVRHDVDLGTALDEAPAVLLDGRLVERAETAAERDQIVVQEPLIADEQQGVIEPRLADRGERGLVEPAQIDAANLGAERGAGRNNLERLDSHPDDAKIAWREGLSFESANGAHRVALGTVLQGDARVPLDDRAHALDTFTVRK